jgi:hypothetical protein
MVKASHHVLCSMLFFLFFDEGGLVARRPCFFDSNSQASPILSFSILEISHFCGIEKEVRTEYCVHVSSH